MQQMTITSWTDYKALISSKKLLIQYVESETDYQLYAPEANEFLWFCGLSKDGGADVTDWEDNHKASANAPLEIKADYARPTRVSSSPQPNNTTEKWKGFHLDLAAEDTSATLDIGFSTDVYLKGGVIYADDASSDDHIQADIVVKAAPSMIVKADILKDVYMLKNVLIPFISSECMLLPSTVMLRVTYTKGSPTDTIRNISALSDYFEVNS